jgi:hypothetical protein
MGGPASALPLCPKTGEKIMLTRIATRIMAALIVGAASSAMAAGNGSGWNFNTPQDLGAVYAPQTRSGTVSDEARRARAQAVAPYGSPTRWYGYGPYPDRPYGDPDE